MLKKEMRQDLLKKRKDIVFREQKEQLIWDKLMPFLAGKSIFCYVSFGSEVSTHRFLKDNFGNSRIYVPFTQGKVMSAVRLIGVKDLAVDKLGNLIEGHFGDYAANCDISIVPMVGFDKRLFRLGYGGGYYDRYLSKTNTLSIGIAFDEQLVECLPNEPFDIPLDMIITPENVYKRGLKWEL